MGLMMTLTEGSWPAIILADMVSCWVFTAALFSWRASCSVGGWVVRGVGSEGWSVRVGSEGWSVRVGSEGWSVGDG